MTTSTLPAPTRSDTAGDDLDHFYCCDENVAMCGVDLTGVPEADNVGDLCPLCALVNESGLPCPVRGCQP